MDGFLSLLEFELLGLGDQLAVGCKAEGEVEEKARISGCGDWQDSGKPWGGTRYVQC